jgi:hypothetical protein
MKDDMSECVVPNPEYQLEVTRLTAEFTSSARFSKVLSGVWQLDHLG